VVDWQPVELCEERQSLVLVSEGEVSGGDVLENRANEHVSLRIRRHAVHRQQRGRHDAATRGESWVDCPRLGLLIGHRKLEIAHRLVSQGDLRHPCDAFKIRADGMRRPQLVEEETPVSPEHHDDAETRVGRRRHDVGRRARMINDDDRDPAQGVAVDFDRAAAGVRQLNGTQPQPADSAACLAECGG
jgi:hypothetical protein